MRFRDEKADGRHPNWLRRLPELYKAKGTITETEVSKRGQLGHDGRGKQYRLNGVLFQLVVATIGNRNDLICEMFNFVTRVGNVTEKDLRQVFACHLSFGTLGQVFACPLTLATDAMHLDSRKV